MITKRTRLSLVGLIGLLLPSGCAHLYDPIDESLSCLHCEVDAAQTWHYVRIQYAHVNYPHHFGAGFRAGYVNVCRGRGECPPTLPPKSYWTVWYRNAAGRAKTVEWFNGFSAGVAVAMQDGYAEFSELVTAPGVTGSCDYYANELEFDLSDVHSPIPVESSSPTRFPVPPPETQTTYPAPPDFAKEVEAAPKVPHPPLAEPPSDSPEPISDAESAPIDAPTSEAAPGAPNTAPTRLPPVPSSPKAVPFGHSVGSAPPPPEHESPDTFGKRPLSEETDPDGDAATSTTKPLLKRSNNPAAIESPSDPRRVPDYQSAPAPPRDVPPLEDRFPPRGMQPQQVPNIKASRHVRPPRSLLEAIGRIQHTSHTAR